MTHPLQNKKWQELKYFSKWRKEWMPFKGPIRWDDMIKYKYEVRLSDSELPNN